MRISDWSSDVCSSDLPPAVGSEGERPDRRAMSMERRHDAPLVDLPEIDRAVDAAGGGPAAVRRDGDGEDGPFMAAQHRQDRKSTRLNSSHYCATRMPSSA